jgi:hypothetical protein
MRLCGACRVFTHRSSDLSALEGIDFQELNACLVNSRTNQQIANCKAFTCLADCRLDNFDAYDDLASIAERLVRVAMPDKECPGQCVSRALFFVLLCKMTAAQVRDGLAAVIWQPDDETPSCRAHAAAAGI